MSVVDRRFQQLKAVRGFPVCVKPSDRFKGFQFKVSVEPWEHIGVSVHEHPFNNPVNERLSGHQVVWLDIDSPGQPILDSDVTLAGVFHQVDGHVANQISDNVDAGLNLWTVR